MRTWSDHSQKDPSLQTELKTEGNDPGAKENWFRPPTRLLEGHIQKPPVFDGIL